MFMFTHFKYIFQSIAAMEEFAYVSANIVFNWKCASWMVEHPLWNIQNILIKNNKFLAICDSLSEFFMANDFR